ncbi:uncharacterized protein DCS_00918 [Drechmeria coniospora]|uniref:Uncharacterized protein n=1 Tax=Drechmeria coniospora TaxID=98403 RepID=A0A151GRN7_DRECN|nr:uncharacterized protein DCS_00918 [Drechmeria coniospora]KYK59784.1 uncharacterized protein DCS_00918 [Drechmeria coniospora]
MDSGKDQQKKEGENQFSIQPIKDKIDAKAAPFLAHPGPPRTKEMPEQEGSKEDRQARKEALNK